MQGNVVEGPTLKSFGQSDSGSMYRNRCSDADRNPLRGLPIFSQSDACLPVWPFDHDKPLENMRNAKSLQTGLNRPLAPKSAAAPAVPSKVNLGHAAQHCVNSPAFFQKSAKWTSVTLPSGTHIQTGALGLLGNLLANCQTSRKASGSKLSDLRGLILKT